MTNSWRLSQAPHVASTQMVPAEFDESERQTLLRDIFEQHFDYVWTSLRRLGVHARDRDDVAQEVFLRVYRRLGDYNRARPIRPWLFAFVFRCVSDWRRLARHREVLDGAPEPASHHAGADEALVRAEDKLLVERALERIDIERRAVFILYELDEHPMKEIAEALEIPLFTAYSRLRVAREEFAAAARRLQSPRSAK